MANRKSRGTKGDGHFLKKGDTHICRIPVGIYENGRTKYSSFSGKTKREVYSRTMEYKAINIDNKPLGDDSFLCDYIKQWLRVYKKDAKAVRQQTYTRMCAIVN